MDVITVEIVCPSTSRNYDYKLPVKMRTDEIKEQIIEDIRIFEGMNTLFDNEKDIHLYSEYGCINDDITPEFAGVRNGDRIMLI